MDLRRPPAPPTRRRRRRRRKYAGDLRSLASLKRKNPNLKLLVSLRPDDYFSFEGTSSAATNETGTSAGMEQQQSATDKTSKPNEMHQKFAKRVRDFIVRHSLDGINLDWPYFAQTISSPKEAREHLSLVLSALNDNFASSLAQSSPSSAYIRLQAPLITLTASRDFHSLVDGYDFHLISKLVDFVHLPAFDFDLNIDQYSIGHPARLHGISDTENLDTLVDLLLSSGLPSEQLVAGLPSHAVQITSKSPTTNSNTTSTNSNHQSNATSAAAAAVANNSSSTSNNFDEQLEAAANISIVSHSEVCRIRDLARSTCATSTSGSGTGNATASCWTMSRARDLTAPFAYDSEHWMGFDDETSIKLKAKYVLLRHLAGAALFTLNQDDSQGRCGFGPYPLLTTINNVFARAAKSSSQQSIAASSSRSSSGGGGAIQFTRAPHHQLTATSLMSNIFGKRPSSSAMTTPSSMSGNSGATNSGDLQTSASEQQPAIAYSSGGNQQQPGLMSFVDIIEKYHSINRLDGPAVKSDASDSPSSSSGSLSSSSSTSGGDELLPCDKIGYQRYPRDCSRFYRCVQTPPATPATPTANGNSHSPAVATLSVSRLQYECPSGLVFDEQYQVCNWPSWSSQCSGSGEVNSITNVKFACPNYGYFQNQENCEFFYYCSDYNTGYSQAYQFRCPFELGFDEEKLQCNWKWLVKGCQTTSNSTTPANEQTSGKNVELARKYLQKLENLDSTSTRSSMSNANNQQVAEVTGATGSSDGSRVQNNQPEIASSSSTTVPTSSSENNQPTEAISSSTSDSILLASSSSTTVAIDVTASSAPTSSSSTPDSTSTLAPELISYSKGRAKRSVGDDDDESSKNNSQQQSTSKSEPLPAVATSGSSSANDAKTTLEKDKEARAITGALISRFVSFFDSMRAFQTHNANRFSWLRNPLQNPNAQNNNKPPRGGASLGISKLSGFGPSSNPKMDMIEQETISALPAGTKGASRPPEPSAAPATKYPSFVGIPSQAIQSAADGQQSSSSSRPMNSLSDSKFLRVRRRQSAPTNLPPDSPSAPSSGGLPYRRPPAPPSILSPFLPTSALYMVVDSIRALGEGIGGEFNRIMRLAGDQMRNWFGVRPPRPLGASRRSSPLQDIAELSAVSNDLLRLNALVQSIGGPGTSYSIDSQSRNRIKRTKRQAAAVAEAAAADDDLQAEESQMSMAGPYASIAAAPAHMSRPMAPPQLNPYRDPLNRPPGYPLNPLDDAAKAAVLGPEPKMFNQPKFIVHPQMTPITQQEYQKLIHSNMESLNGYMQPIGYPQASNGMQQQQQSIHRPVHYNNQHQQPHQHQYGRQTMLAQPSNILPQQMLHPRPEVSPTQELTSLVEQAKSLIAMQQNHQQPTSSSGDHMQFAESQMKEVPFGMPSMIRPSQQLQQQQNGDLGDELQATTTGLNVDSMTGKKRRSTVAQKLATLAMPRFITGPTTPHPPTSSTPSNNIDGAAESSAPDGGKKTSGGYMSFLPSLSNVVVAPARSFMSKAMDINKAVQELISTLAPGMRPSSQQSNNEDQQQGATGSNGITLNPQQQQQQTRTSPLPLPSLPQISPLPQNLQQFQHQHQQHQFNLHAPRPGHNNNNFMLNQQQSGQHLSDKTPINGPNMEMNHHHHQQHQHQQHDMQNHQQQNQFQINNIQQQQQHQGAPNKTSGFVLPPQLMLTEQEARALSAQLDQLSKEQLEMLSSQFAQVDQKYPRPNGQQPQQQHNQQQQQQNKNQDYALKLLKMVSQTSHNPEDVKLLEQLLTQLASPGSRPSDLDHKLIEIGQADDQALLEMLGLIPRYPHTSTNGTKPGPQPNRAEEQQQQQQQPMQAGLADGRQIMQPGAMRGLLVGHPPKQRYMQQQQQQSGIGKKRRRPDSDYLNSNLNKDDLQQQQQVATNNDYVRYPKPAQPYKQPYIKQEIYKLPAPIIQNYEVYYPKPQPYYTTTTTTTTTTTARPYMMEIIEEKVTEERPLPPVQQTFTEVIESNVTTPDGIETSVETRTKTAVSGGANFNVASQVGLGMIPQPFGGAVGLHNQRHALAPPPARPLSPSTLIRGQVTLGGAVKGASSSAGFVDQQQQNFASEASLKAVEAAHEALGGNYADASGPAATVAVQGTKGLSGAAITTSGETSSSASASGSLTGSSNLASIQQSQQQATSGFFVGGSQQSGSQLNQVGGRFAGGLSPAGYDFSSQPVSQMEEIVIKKKFKPFPKKVVVPQTSEFIEEFSRKQPIVQQITSFSSEEQQSNNGQQQGFSADQQQQQSGGFGGFVAGGSFEQQQQEALLAQNEQQTRQQMFGFQQQLQQQQQQQQDPRFASSSGQFAAQSNNNQFGTLTELNGGPYSQVANLEQIRLDDHHSSTPMSMTGQDIVLNRLLDEVKKESFEVGQNGAGSSSSSSSSSGSSINESLSFGETSASSTTSSTTSTTPSPIIDSSSSSLMAEPTSKTSTTSTTSTTTTTKAPNLQRVDAAKTTKKPTTAKVVLVVNTSPGSSSTGAPTTRVPIIETTRTIDNVDARRITTTSSELEATTTLELQRSNKQKGLKTQKSAASSSKAGTKSATFNPKSTGQRPNSTPTPMTTIVVEEQPKSNATTSDEANNGRRRKRKSRSKKSQSAKSTTTNGAAEERKASMVEHMAASASNIRPEIVKNRPAIEAGEHVAIYGTKSGFMPILRLDDPSYMILQQEGADDQSMQEPLSSSDSFISSKHQSPNMMSITHAGEPIVAIGNQQQAKQQTSSHNKQLQKQLNNDHLSWKNFVRHRLRDQISVVNLGNISSMPQQTEQKSSASPISSSSKPLIPVKLVILPASPNNQLLDRTNWNYLAAQYPLLFPVDMKNVSAMPIDLGSPSIGLESGLIDERSEAMRLASFGRQFESVSRLIEPQTFKALDEIVQRSSGQLFVMQTKQSSSKSQMQSLTMIAVIPDGPLIKQRHNNNNKSTPSSTSTTSSTTTTTTSHPTSNQSSQKNDWSYYQRQVASSVQQQAASSSTSPSPISSISEMTGNENHNKQLEQISTSPQQPAASATSQSKSTSKHVNNNLPQSHKAAAMSRAIQESIQGAIRQHYDSMKNQIRQSLKQHQDKKSSSASSSNEHPPITTIITSEDVVESTSPRMSATASSTPFADDDAISSSASAPSANSHNWSTPEAGALANLDPLDASGSSTEYSIIEMPKQQQQQQAASKISQEQPITASSSRSIYEIEGAESKSLYGIDDFSMTTNQVANKLQNQRSQVVASSTMTPTMHDDLIVASSSAPAHIVPHQDQTTTTTTTTITSTDEDAKLSINLSKNSDSHRNGSRSNGGRFISIGSHLIASPKKLPKIVDQAYVNHFYDHISDQQMSEQLSLMDDHQQLSNGNSNSGHHQLVDDLDAESRQRSTSSAEAKNMEKSTTTTSSEELLVPESACTRAGLFQHPFACNKFYECFWDKQMNKFTLHMFECPIRLAFDERIVGCAMPIESSLCVNY